MENKEGWTKTFRLIALIFLTLLLCVPPALGQASENPASEIDRVAFDQALREDKLTLVPVGGIEIGDGERPLSLSPDGEKLLMLSDDGLSVCSLADGTRTPLKPREGNSHLSEEQMQNLFSAPEVTATSWSADGRYLSFSFPAHVFRRMLAASNVWVADLETGEVDPLFDLPDGISMVDLHGGNPSDVPVRAVFDPDRPVLYYNVLSADAADGDRPILDRYFQLYYKTGETVPIGDIPFDMVSGDPCLRRIGGRLVTTVAYNAGIKGGAGLASMAEGETPQLTLAKEGFLAAFLYGARLLDAHGRDAVLYQPGHGYDIVYGRSEGYRRIMRLMECALNDQGEAQFGAALAVEPGAPPQSRLLRFSVEELDDDETNEAVFQRYMRQEITYCFNAAFSPDGGYLLLAAQGGDGSKGLYVHNRVTGECGRVALPEDFEAELDTMAFVQEAGLYMVPGIQWSAGDRLLLFDGNINCLYALAVQP